MESCKEGHKVLQGTNDYMLMHRWADYLEVTGYSDVDFVGCMDSRKSTSRYIFMLAGGAIFWWRVK